MESAEFQGKNETFSKEKIESAQPVKESTTHGIFYQTKNSAKVFGMS